MTKTEFDNAVAALVRAQNQGGYGLDGFSDVFNSITSTISDIGTSIWNGVSNIASGAGNVLASLTQNAATVLGASGGIFAAYQASKQPPVVTPQQATAVASQTAAARAQLIQSQLYAQGIDTSSPAATALINQVAAQGVTGVFPPAVHNATLAVAAPTQSDTLNTILQYAPYALGAAALIYFLKRK